MADTSGFYGERHYSTYVDEFKALKRSGDYVRAEALLLNLVKATENEARVNRWCVAPGYYHHLAVIYRKTKQFEKELEILERYARHWRSQDGPLPEDIAEAIRKARQRLGKETPTRSPGTERRRAAPTAPRRAICSSCGFEHSSLTRCPRCGTAM